MVLRRIRTYFPELDRDHPEVGKVVVVGRQLVACGTEIDLKHFVVSVHKAGIKPHGLREIRIGILQAFQTLALHLIHRLLVKLFGLMITR